DANDGVCDASHCSLREAINAANALGGTDTIAFSIPAPHTIQPTSGLPTVTDPVIIDGTTQPGFAGAPIIELDGSNAGTGSVGLRVDAGDSTVRALVINRFGGDGIDVFGQGNTIVANVVSANGQEGLLVFGDGTVIQGNRIGT